MNKASRHYLSSLIVIISLLILGVTATANADANWSVTFSNTGYDFYQENYYDGSGWINLTVGNESNQTWGDFHLFIFEYPPAYQLPGGNYDITSVIFEVSGANNPTSSQSPLTWSTSTDKKEIDLFYYSDPVAPTETATFSVHIDNPTYAMHGVGFYPTVVPEPVSSTLFLVGAATLGFRRFRKNK